jgi:hypothetical protein
MLHMVAGRGMEAVSREPSHVQEMRTVLEEIGGFGFLSDSRSRFECETVVMSAFEEKLSHCVSFPDRH